MGDEESLAHFQRLLAQLVWGFGKVFLILVADAQPYFLAVDGDVLGCFDAESDLIAVDAEHDDFDVFADYQRSSSSTGKYQHYFYP
jgi:hypothetical protein